MKHIGKAFFALFLAQAAWASTDPSATAIEAKPADTVSWEGTLDCELRKYSKTDYVQVDFVRAEDGESIKVSGPSQELSAFCPKEGAAPTKLKLEGRVTSKFLLWGGNLEVSKFQVSKM